MRRSPLTSPASPRILAGLRQALRENATPVGAPPTPEPDTAFMLCAATRSTEIIGHMLDTMSDQYASLMKKPAAFLVRSGRIGWGLVEAAMPRTTYNLLMHYWFKLLLIVELIMIIGGTLISGAKAAQGLGVKLLTLTLIFRALIELMRLYLEHLRISRKLIAVFVLLVFFFLWRGVVQVQDSDIPAIKKKFEGAKQNYLCGWLGCESAAPPAKQ